MSSSSYQGLPCECCWCNCGQLNAGWACLLCCCGVWTDKQDQMKLHNNDQNYCFKSPGFGFNVEMYGCVMCTPQWLQNYSRSLMAVKR